MRFHIYLADLKRHLKKVRIDRIRFHVTEFPALEPTLNGFEFGMSSVVSNSKKNLLETNHCGYQFHLYKKVNQD